MASLATPVVSEAVGGMPGWERCIGLRNAQFQSCREDPASIRYANVQLLWWPTVRKLLEFHQSSAVLLYWRPSPGTASAPCWHIQVSPLDRLGVSDLSDTLEHWAAKAQLTLTSEATNPRSQRRTLGYTLPDTNKSGPLVLSDLVRHDWTPQVLGLRGSWLGTPEKPTGYLHLVVDASVDTVSSSEADLAVAAANSARLAQLFKVATPTPFADNASGAPDPKRGKTSTTTRQRTRLPVTTSFY